MSIPLADSVGLKHLSILLTTALCVSSVSIGQHSKHTGKQPVPSRQSRHLEISAINDVSAKETIKIGSTGSAVVRAAILLDRLHYSPGEIDPTFNSNMDKAAKTFQSVMKLPINGVIDATVWDALDKAQQTSSQVGENNPVQAVIPYIVAIQDVSGPFTKLPHPTGRNSGERLILEEAHLKQLNYDSP